MDPLWATIGAGNLSHNRNTRKGARDNHLFKFLGEDSARLERATVAGGRLGGGRCFSLPCGGAGKRSVFSCGVEHMVGKMGTEEKAMGHKKPNAPHHFCSSAAHQCRRSSLFFVVATANRLPHA